MRKAFERAALRALAAIALYLLALCALSWLLSGCAYRGGKVVDGTNMEIGMTVPGTEWSINFLSYTGGARVCGNDQTCIAVDNEVAETNSYFGIVRTTRRSRLTATIEPTEAPSPPEAP